MSYFSVCPISAQWNVNRPKPLNPWHRAVRGKTGGITSAEALKGDIPTKNEDLKTSSGVTGKNQDTHNRSF